MSVPARSAPLLLGIACILACSKMPTTPPGPLGVVDLKSKLPGGVTAPPESELKSNEATLSICTVGEAPAEVLVKWKSFTRGDDGYITRYSVELTKASNGLTLALGAPANVGRAPIDPHLAVASVEVKCSGGTSQVGVDETETLFILSNGQASKKK